MEVSTWFILVFVLMWVAGPLTQLLFLIAPKLHYKLGLMEAEFKWYLLEEKALAIADMSYLASGAAFVSLAARQRHGCAVRTVYLRRLCVLRSDLYTKNRFGHPAQMSPVSKEQLGVYLSYACLYLLFGLYGLFYLWGLTQS